MILHFFTLLLFGECLLLSTAAVDTIKLSTGSLIPTLGLGTWQATNETELRAALQTAFDSGYRLIDTAYHYHNEHIIGKYLKEQFDSGKLKREDVFITTKLPMGAHDPKDVEKCVEGQLKALQTDYIDLYLIHGPVPFQGKNGSYDIGGKPVTINHLDTWKAMEKLYDAGKLKVECHLYWPQDELYELCRKLNISFTAYAPLGSPGRKAGSPDMPWPEGAPLLDPAVKEIAENHNKTSAQVLLRYVLQNGGIAIPKSVKPKHVKENINVFDFTLSNDEMKRLKDVKTRTRLFIWPFAFGHPFFPFADVDQSKYAEPQS